MSEPTWELLGGGGVVGGPIDYVGAWAAGTTYQPGQVVRYNGVDYLAVNASLGQTPPNAVGLLGVLGYAEITALVALTTGGVDVIPSLSFTSDGRPLWIETYFPFLQFQSAAATIGDSASLALVIDGVSQTVFVGNMVAVQMHYTPVGQLGVRAVLSSGSHTVKVTGIKAVTSGAPVTNVFAGTGGAGAFSKGWLRVRYE